MLIGIGGVSRAGKSTLANSLIGHFRSNGKKAIVLHQDDFVFPETQIPKIRNLTDWESPESVDFELFRETLIFFNEKFDVVIADGLFAFYDDATNVLFDKRLYVKISKRTFFIRKLADTRWGYIPTWFIDHIWTSFLKYGKPSLGIKGILTISGEEEFDIERVIKYLDNSEFK